jgi:hypothetical protein
MLSRINKLKSASKRFAKAHGIVPRYLKATAPLWAIEREGRNDSVPSGFQGPTKARDIRRTIMFLGEEVKCCPIMPDVIRL